LEFCKRKHPRSGTAAEDILV